MLRCIAVTYDTPRPSSQARRRLACPQASSAMNHVNGTRLPATKSRTTPSIKQ